MATIETVRRIVASLMALALAGCAGREVVKQPTARADEGTRDAGSEFMSQESDAGGYPMFDPEQGPAQRHDLVTGSASDVDQPAIVVEAARRYLIGFPAVISVTYANFSASIGIGNLPWIGGPTWTVRGIGLTLEPVQGGARVDEPARHWTAEDLQGAPTVDLLPRQAWRGFIDITNYGIEIRPGVYRLSISTTEGTAPHASSPVTVEFVAPSPRDAKEAARLRALGRDASDTDDGRWMGFLEDNWSTVTVSPALSPEAKRQLALYLFLHRAFYGPEGVGQLNPAPLDAITEPSLQAEVMLLKLEIVIARGDPTADALSNDLLRRFRGSGHRIDGIHRGMGEIRSGREIYGPENPDNMKRPVRPYTR
jgi:hypothetical protein